MNTNPQNQDQQAFVEISKLLLERKGLKSIVDKGSKGSFGMVLFVQDKKTNIKYAVKAQSIISQMNAGIDEFKYNICKSESEILKSINHKNVVEYHSDYLINFNHFIQMNLCDCSLDDWIEQRGNKPLSNQLFLHYLYQILDGIEHLHSHGYVLRDLSNRNILISSDGTIKLCDFGLAQKIDSKTMESHIQSNSHKGAMLYYPPELKNQIASNSKLYTQSKKGDIWALGICLRFLGGANIFDIQWNNDSQQQIKKAPLLDNFCNSIIEYILKEDPKERPTIPEIRKFIFDQLIQNKQQIQINKPNLMQKSQEQIDAFYNQRDIDIDISKYKEIEKECQNDLINIESKIKLGYINLYSKENIGDAYKYFIDALELDQKDPDVYLGLSQLHIEMYRVQKQNNLEKVEYYIDKANNISPNYWRVHFQRFQYYFLLEKNDLAKQYLQKSIEIKKNHPILICFKNYLKSQKSKNLQKNQERLQQLENDNIQNKYRYYYQLLACIAFHSQEYDKSIQYCYQELRYFPQCSFTYFFMGFVNEKIQQYSEAQKSYQKAIELNPLFDQAKTNLDNLTNQLQFKDNIQIVQ